MSCTLLLICKNKCIRWTMPKRMYISTRYNKGISSPTIVQCTVACKWLQPGSGQVDAFLTGLVDACVNLPRDAPNLGESSCRELPRTPGSVYEGNPAQNKSTWQKAKPFNDPNQHPCYSIDSDAAKVTRTTGRKVARTLVPKKELKSAKRQKDKVEETCQCFFLTNRLATAGRVRSG